MIRVGSFRQRASPDRPQPFRQRLLDFTGGLASAPGFPPGIPMFVGGLIVPREQNKQPYGTWRPITARNESTEATKRPWDLTALRTVGHDEGTRCCDFIKLLLL